MGKNLYRGFYINYAGPDQVYINNTRYNGSWIEGSYVKIKDSSSGEEFYKHYIIKDNLTPPENWFEVIPETVGQFTGLICNKQKIFEDDVVEFTTTNYRISGVVNWCKSDFRFVVKQMFPQQTFPMKIEWDYKVFGNIYSNPELKKKCRC